MLQLLQNLCVCARVCAYVCQDLHMWRGVTCTQHTTYSHHSSQCMKIPRRKAIFATFCRIFCHCAGVQKVLHSYFWEQLAALDKQTPP